MDDPPPQRTAQISIPSRRAVGGTTLLETVLLIATARLVTAKRVFEFGTFLGANTLNLALNLPVDGEVFTLDLDGDSLAAVEQHPADAELTQMHFHASEPLDFVGSVAGEKVRVLSGNSRAFDFSAWEHSIDLVFIDGGHDLDTVRADTENALKMLVTQRMAAIVWHDFGNADYPELTVYLDGLAEQMPLFHIADTMLCMYFSNPDARVRSL